MIDQRRLKELIHYDPDTGVFTWLKQRGGTARVGSPVGWTTDRGYRVVAINRRQYGLGRLAWLYMTGKWPEEEIDHIDLDKLNNRWSNLREATRQKNCANRGQWNKHGLKGIFSIKKSARNPFGAFIRVDGKNHYLGCFPTKELAHEAYCAAAVKFFGNFARRA